MLRILFVDDDTSLLDSLRRMSHKQRDKWQAEFANSGAEALSIMAEHPFDVIVADMRMPKMDGGELLKSVAEQYPDTIRFILSGHSDKELIFKAIPWTHQFIAKPCESTALQKLIQSSMNLRDLLASPVLHERLSAIKSLPSLPATYTQLCAELQSENGTVKRAAKTIEKDAGLTAKILQLVNSAFFSLPRHIESLEQAVGLLGLETIRTLTLMTGVFSDESVTDNGTLSVSSLFDHCAAVGSIAKRVGQTLDVDHRIVEDAFFAGALHDIGKLIILRDFRKELGEIETLVANDGLSEEEAEIVTLGVSHAIIGAHLLAIWGIPHPIIEAVAYHHTPNSDIVTEVTPTVIVYIADRIAHYCDANEEFAVFKSGLDSELLDKLGINEHMEDLYEISSQFAVSQEEANK